MRVAIIGGGALGKLYGAHLACRGGCEVDLVGRRARPAVRVRVVRAGDESTFDWTASPQVNRVPPTAEVVVVSVPYDQLDAAVERIREGDAPVVVMTPMLPQDQARLSATLPGRVIPAMPGVVAYESAPSTIRYWLPRVATTLVSSTSPGGPERELVARLGQAGIRSRLEPDVFTRNLATTVSFVPFAMALDAAGGIDAALADHRLVALALDAAAEGRELGRAVGKPEAWASTLLRFVGPGLLKVGIAFARSRSPEGVAYVELHFGKKLHAQNVLMARRIIELAKEKGTPRTALERLLDRLAAPSAKG